MGPFSTEGTDARDLAFQGFLCMIVVETKSHAPVAELAYAAG